MASATFWPWPASSSRRSRQAVATPSRTCRNEGIPNRGSSGKYVPA
jgi:hypothetical protein